MTMGSWVLYDTVFNIRYRVVCFSYLVICYGDKGLGYMGGLRPGHTVVIQYVAHVRKWNQNSARNYCCMRSSG